MRRIFLMAGLAAASWAAATAPGLAHVRLIDAYPARNAHVGAGVTKIEIHFAGRADAHFSTLELTGDDGETIASTTQAEARPEMTLPTPPLGPGNYRVRYRVLSTDGDIVAGELAFVVD